MAVRGRNWVRPDTGRRMCCMEWLIDGHLKIDQKLSADNSAVRMAA